MSRNIYQVEDKQELVHQSIKERNSERICKKVERRTHFKVEQRRNAFLRAIFLQIFLKFRHILSFFESFGKHFLL